MTDEERMAILSKVEAELNTAFNGDPASNNPNKRFVWGLVAYDAKGSDGEHGDVLLAANTQDTSLLGAMFSSASVRVLGITAEDITNGQKH